MALVNTIKIQQIDTGQLLSFMESGLGLRLSTNTSAHANTEVFSGNVIFSGNINAVGVNNFSGAATFHSGLLSRTGIQVEGNISGRSLTIDNFAIPTGTIGTVNIGSLSLTGVPIYESGSAAAAVLLPSGTVFGIKQRINAPQFEETVSGDYTPATGLGVSVVMLCVSIGI